MSLTPKQEAFARSYVETGNASEAYRQAYNVGENTKAETVNKRASELLSNGEVTGNVVKTSFNLGITTAVFEEPAAEG